MCFQVHLELLEARDRAEEPGHRGPLVLRGSRDLWGPQVQQDPSGQLDHLVNKVVYAREVEDTWEEQERGFNVDRT